MDPAEIAEAKRLKRLQELKRIERSVNIENIRIGMDKKAENSSLSRRIHLERREANRERLIALSKESQNWRKDELEQEEALAFEMDKKNREEIVAKKMRQIVQEAPEIKELERQLLTAYTNKDLIAQIKENSAKEMHRKMLEIEISKSRVKCDAALAELELKTKEEEEKRKIEYKAILQHQIIAKHQEKQEAYKRTLEEQALIDDAVRTIREEDRRLEEARLQQKLQCREDEEAFRRAQAIWVQREKELQEEEERKIKEFLELKFAREKALQEMNIQKQQNYSKRKTAVASMLSEEESKRIEREDVCRFLAVEDQKMKEAMAEKQRMEKAWRDNIEIKEIFAKQVEERLARLQEEKQKDIEYGRQILAQYMESEKIAQLTAHQQRQKRLEYAQQLREEMEKRHMDRIVEARKICQAQKFEEKAGSERARLIQEERIRLLKEHAEKLIGFLPKGVLQESDLPYLNEAVKDYYSSTKKPSDATL